tara:strand:- start:272 stop:811 length:540 start_codon:yes stop_codon:yes gene_type:complete
LGALNRLITVTTITIISRYFELDLTDITVFGLSLTEDNIAPITLIILIFLLVNYILNYWGDHVSFKEWNTDDETGKNFNEISHIKLEGTFTNINSEERTNINSEERTYIKDVEIDGTFTNINNLFNAVNVTFQRFTESQPDQIRDFLNLKNSITDFKRMDKNRRPYLNLQNLNLQTNLK